MKLVIVSNLSDDGVMAINIRLNNRRNSAGKTKKIVKKFLIH